MVWRFSIGGSNNIASSSSSRTTLIDTTSSTPIAVASKNIRLPQMLEGASRHGTEFAQRGVLQQLLSDGGAA